MELMGEGKRALYNLLSQNPFVNVLRDREKEESLKRSVCERIWSSTEDAPVTLTTEEKQWLRDWLPMVPFYGYGRVLQGVVCALIDMVNV